MTAASLREVVAALPGTGATDPATCIEDAAVTASITPVSGTNFRVRVRHGFSRSLLPALRGSGRRPAGRVPHIRMCTVIME